MGTPIFSVPILDKLNQEYELVGVVTQPDRPSGRGQKLIQSAVKDFTTSNNIPVFQPLEINSPESLNQIRVWNPELIVVAAFGQILKPELLTFPKHGCLNVHASLLPRWRGAAPINAAILQGDTTTGVTIMKMAEGLDNGPILSQKSIPIDPDDTAGTLSDQLSTLGAALLIETIPPYIKGEIQPSEQDHSLATHAGMLKKKDGLLDFNKPADYLARKVRAYSPWPGSYANWNDQRLLIHQVSSVNVTSPGPGVFTTHEDYPAIGSVEGILVLEYLQLAGKRKIAGDEFLKGAADWVS